MITKAGKLREMDALELERMLLENAQKLFQMRYDQRAGQIKNPLQIRMLRRESARIRTILKEKARGSQ